MRFPVFALVLVLILPVPSAHAQLVAAPAFAEQLTLQEVLRHTYLNNPTLGAAREELRATQEELARAYAGWKPSVAASTDVTRTSLDGDGVSGSADGSTEKNLELSLSQPLYTGGRTEAQVAAARATIKAQEEVLRLVEQDVLLQAAIAYMDVVRDRALLDLSVNNRDVIARQLKAARDRFTAGEVTRTDVSQAEARYARAESEIIRSQGALNTSLAVFEQVVGVPAGPLAQPSYSFTFPDNVDEMALAAESGSPLVLSAIHAQDAAENDVDNVYGELLPAVGLFTRWDKAYDPSPGLIDDRSTAAVGISASIPLYEAGGVRARVRQAKHTANQRYIEILESKRLARQRATSAWQNLKSAQAEIITRESEVQASRVANEGVHAEQEYGTRTVLDALDADQELLDAQVALVTAQRDEIVAEFTLLSVLGDLSPGTLGFPDMRIDDRGREENLKWKIFDMHVDRVGSTQ